MNSLSEITSAERFLCAKADLTHTPIGGTFELTPLCNMNCRMCYIRMNREEMESSGRMLNVNEWLHIGEEAAKAGTLFLLLTGGEPLLYPNFDKLYQGLKELGLILTINSNGTLITEEIGELLGTMPPRRINITLYGASNQTYEKLCQNPQGFTQVMRGVELLLDKGVPVKFNCSLTPYNVQDLDKLCQISKEYDIPIEIAHYMFLPVRKTYQKTVPNTRFTPRDAAEYYIKVSQFLEGEAEFRQRMNLAMKAYMEHKDDVQNNDCRITCRAGTSTYWINWKGQMSACGMIEQGTESVIKEGFRESWTKVSRNTRKSCISKECANCNKKIFCQVCAASSYAETGKIDGVPQYMCEMTDAIIDILNEKII